MHIIVWAGIMFQLLGKIARRDRRYALTYISEDEVVILWGKAYPYLNVEFL